MEPLISLPLHILGAGRVGRAIAIRARAAGQPIGSVVASTVAHARDAVAVIGAGEAREAIPDGATGMVLVALPDRLLATVAARARAVGARGLLWIHTAGAIGLDALGDAIENQPRAAVHPLSAFTDPIAAAARFTGTPCAFEGDAGTEDAIEAWIAAIGGKPIRLIPGAKARYHAAATMSVTGAMAAADAAITLLQSCGLAEPDARALLLPLLRANVENLATKTPPQALTGPVQRGDAATIAAHLADTSSWPPDALSLYLHLLGPVADLAARGGTAAEALAEIRRIAGQA
jgi:predicted short-subunit dehydrogenase-like oxidoreductase (DUF2520 family)